MPTFCVDTVFKDELVDSFYRLLPFVWPYRRRLIAAIILGILVAALWGLNLTAAYPIVRVLLKRENLHKSVQQEIDEAAAAAAEAEENLARVQERIDAVLAQGIALTDQLYLDELRRRTRVQEKLAAAERNQYRFRLLQSYVMPFVPSKEFHAFTWILILVLFATLVKGILIFIQDVLVGSVAESAVGGVRKKLLKHVLQLDYQSLSQAGSSSLMSRFTYDAEQLSQGILLLGGRLIREPLKCLSCMVLALLFNWRLTLLSLFFIPLLGLFLYRFGKMLKQASGRMMERMSQIYKVLQETFDGLKVVIGYDNAAHHQALFDKNYEGYFKKAMKVVKIDAAAKPLLELLGLTAMFVALIPAAYLVIRMKEHIWGMRLATGVMDSEDFALLYVLLVGMLDPCRKLSSAFSRLKKSSAAIDRIFQLVDQQTLIADVPRARPFNRHQDSIEFRDVSFRYPVSDAKKQRGLALEHVDLKVEAGEVIAIVGQNGCGKSTLVNLLPRFYDPEAGEVLIDGRSLKEIPLSDLRSQVGIVTQETILFDDTILANISYGSPQATRAQIEEAARQAHVLPIVESFPQGFETMMGGHGKELSGGQRQRIALARAILRDPSILILDEATSAADAESESLIHHTLKTFVSGRTAFVISHTMSQSLLDFVTRIVVMENGKIVAAGAHEQLLQICPIYDRLFNSPSRQLGNSSAKAA